MTGYETRLLTHLVLDHLKPRNISEGGLLRRTWQLGVRDYALGYHPLFQAFKCLSRLFEPPLLAGAIVWWVGYCTAAVQRREMGVPKDLLQFIRSEQILRLRNSIALRSPRAQHPEAAVPAAGNPSGD